MKISEQIAKLQAIQEEYGDLDVYEYTDWGTIQPYYQSTHRPGVRKIYSQKWEDAEHMRDELSGANIDESDEHIHDVDLSKPIVIGVVI